VERFGEHVFTDAFRKSPPRQLAVAPREGSVSTNRRVVESCESAGKFYLPRIVGQFESVLKACVESRAKLRKIDRSFGR